MPGSRTLVEGGVATLTFKRDDVRNALTSSELVAEIPRVVRLVGGLVLSLREEPYVAAAITSGSAMPKILVRHVLPNIAAPLFGGFAATGAIARTATNIRSGNDTFSSRNVRGIMNSRKNSGNAACLKARVP